MQVIQKELLYKHGLHLTELTRYSDVRWTKVAYKLVNILGVVWSTHYMLIVLSSLLIAVKKEGTLISSMLFQGRFISSTLYIIAISTFKTVILYLVPPYTIASKWEVLNRATYVSTEKPKQSS